MRANDTTATPGAVDRLAMGLLPLLAFVFLLATARGYGYFRDELYYLVCGRHLAFGYVDQPPLIGLIAALVQHTVGTSLLAIRALPALAGACTVALAAAIARELGGGVYAQRLAALAVLCSPTYLSLFSILSMNAVDVLIWASCFWLACRILRTGNERLWLAFGALAGFGLENKISLLFLGAGLVVGLIAARRWDVLRSRWLWLGGLLALLLFTPYLVWQQQHGWPTLEFMRNAERLKNVSMTPAQFLLAQMRDQNLFAVPVWAAGVLFLAFSRRSRAYRPLAWIWPVLFVYMSLSNAKPYYLAPVYSLLFAAGSVAMEEIEWSSRVRLAVQSLVVVLVVLGGAISAPFAKPLLSEDAFVAYSEALGQSPRAEENTELDRLPQFFADMHGWPELARTVSEVYRQLPSDDRARACVFGQNYGEAAAVEILGEPGGRPPVISGHNSYYLWGPGQCSGEVMLVIGDRRSRLQEFFEEVERGGTFECRDCMPYENHRPIWVARGLRMSVVDLWPQVKHFI